MFTIDAILNITKGIYLQNNNTITTITQLAIDSRKITYPNSTLFFAIVSTYRNGHQYLQSAYSKGVRCFVVSENVALTTLENATILQVPNTIAALQQLAIAQRNAYPIPTIGITGSNGKTIVKEWLYQLLQKQYNIVRSPKSYNSQIGVALSVCNINATNTLAIFEAGISTINEMQYLQTMIQPTLGILTNIGNAHSEGFANDEEKLQQKLKLFTQCDTLIYCNNKTWVTTIVNTLPCNKLSWGNNADADIQIVITEKFATYSLLHLLHKGCKATLLVQFIDDAYIENAMHCIVTLVYLQYSFDEINKLLTTLVPIAMRLEHKRGIENSIIINDSYSNDVDSLLIALDAMQQQNPLLPKTVILTDIQQSQSNNEELYTKVAGLLMQKGITNFIGIGSNIMQCSKQFEALPYTQFYNNVTDLCNAYKGNTNNELTVGLHNIIHQHVVLIKGARQFGIENFAQLIEEKVHQTVLEINIDLVRENIQKHQLLLQPTTHIMAVVKAFGYGSGAVEVAQVIQSMNIKYLAVAYTDEAVALRQAGIYLPIMVMNTDSAAYESLLANDGEPEIFSIESLESFIAFAKKNALIQYPIHLKIDTGMHRLGFTANDLPMLITMLTQQNTVKVMTQFSHLVGSDAEEFDAYTQQQNTEFVQIATAIETAIGYTTIKHIANTAAIQRHSNLQHQMVRLGIGMYGVTTNTIGLQQVCTLKTTIAQIKHLQPNQTVGYNRKGIITQPTTIATVRIGYADGYNRRLGNGIGKMLLHNQLVPTIGNISMDMAMLNISQIPNAKVGDTVTVFDNQITVQQLATACGTIPYEILTSISQRVKRVYFGS